VVAVTYKKKSLRIIFMRMATAYKLSVQTISIEAERSNGVITGL